MSFQFNLTPTEKAGARALSETRSQLVSGFKKRRAEWGLRQAHIAEKIGVHRSVINRELNGDKGLTVMRVGELAEAMGYYMEVCFIPKENVDVQNQHENYAVAGVAVQGVAIKEYTLPNQIDISTGTFTTGGSVSIYPHAAFTPMAAE